MSQFHVQDGAVSVKHAVISNRVHLCNPNHASFSNELTFLCHLNEDGVELGYVEYKQWLQGIGVSTVCKRDIQMCITVMQQLL